MVNWSSIPHGSKLGRLLRAPLASIPRSCVVPILSGPNRRFRWCVGAADHGCWLGSYELEKQLAIWRIRPLGATALDIGANVGFYTLLMARAVGVAGQVVAIEPDRRNAAWLRWHVRLNHVPNVQIVVGAVTACSGTATFSPGATHTTGRVVAKGAGKAIRSYRLDDLVFAGDMPIPAIVKMDIEGGESAALAGANDLLAARQTTWFLALHSPQQAESCAATFRRHNYRLSLLDGTEVSADDERELSEIVAIPRTSDARV